MAVDPALCQLGEPVEEGQPWPRPRCPSCDSGHVRFGKPDDAEGYSSASARNHPGFEPEWITGTFSIRGECENPSCRQAIHGAGDYFVANAKKSVSDDPWQETGPEYSAFYRVSQLHPPPRLVLAPQLAPEEVQTGLLRAARVLLADAGLAGTALRSAVERFLTSEGVPSIGSSGRFRSAHERIEEWRAADTNRVPVARLFIAVKWLGNVGTHEDSDLTIAEVLEGADLLDEAFHRIYTGPNIDARAQSINSAKGPHRAG